MEFGFYSTDFIYQPSATQTSVNV